LLRSWLRRFLVALSARITKETWCEAEVYRRAGQIELMLPLSDVQRAEDNFARDLAAAAGALLGVARGDESGAALA
jgi:hypothetical protein